MLPLHDSPHTDQPDERLFTVSTVPPGGNAAYSDLKPGDRFRFPQTALEYEKKRGGWFTRVGSDNGARYRTGSGTAVVRIW